MLEKYVALLRLCAAASVVASSIEKMDDRQEQQQRIGATAVPKRAPALVVEALCFYYLWVHVY